MHTVSPDWDSELERNTMFKHDLIDHNLPTAPAQAVGSLGIQTLPVHDAANQESLIRQRVFERRMRRERRLARGVNRAGSGWKVALW